MEEVETIIPGIPDHQIDAWEMDHEATLPQLSDREWLEMFPEAKPILEAKSKCLEKKIDSLKLRIFEKLEKIKDNPSQDEFTHWFRKEIVRVWEGSDLNQATEDKNRIDGLLRFQTVKRIDNAKDFARKVEIAKTSPRVSLAEITGIKNPQRMIKCPFHEEKSPSFGIYQKKGKWRYKCFGCNVQGDSIKYLMSKDKLTFKQAVEYLAG